MYTGKVQSKEEGDRTPRARKGGEGKTGNGRGHSRGEKSTEKILKPIDWSQITTKKREKNKEGGCGG